MAIKIIHVCQFITKDSTGQFTGGGYMGKEGENRVSQQINGV